MIYKLIGAKYGTCKTGKSYLTLYVIKDEKKAGFYGFETSEIPFFGENADQALDKLSSLEGGIDSACKDQICIQVNGYFKDFKLIGCALSIPS